MESISDGNMQALVSQMSTLAGEILDMRKSVSNIEDNVCEISVKNGGGLNVTLKTRDLLEKLYEHTKPNGIIDVKLQSQADKQIQACTAHQVRFEKSINDCREEHSPQHRVKVLNKSIAPWETLGRSILWIILFGMIVFSFFFNKQDRQKQGEETRAIVKTEIEKLLSK